MTDATSESFWQKISDWIKQEWSDIETWAEDEVKAFISAFSPFVSELTAGQFTILSNLAKTALADIGSGDYAGLVQAVLMQAETQELAWVAQLSEDFLTAFIAVTAQNAGVAGGSTSTAS